MAFYPSGYLDVPVMKRARGPRKAGWMGLHRAATETGKGDERCQTSG